MQISGSPIPRATPVRRVGLADHILGGVGAAVIAVTLFAARAWARVTRSPYYDD
ncbi:hypothetical protein [Lichenifustis flavocetrariae]|uniref:Uncharacterized protein n=1 Tax=Lichenifustis flavocetrariae TaxID=2949735 RepID=A0AA41YXG7_9HYPH|nr:hypothetical protein [Lichenifustis flavocetrariae]MCW6510371.1 hypothetical protein [Lichenifustis flavocetrariae]